MGFIRKLPPVVWLLLFGLWVLFSGKFGVFHLSSGALVVILIAWLHSHLPTTDEAAPPLRTLRFIAYGPWLLWQMILSSVYVSKAILSPSRHLDPELFAFRSAQQGELPKFILANSITLTPGTLTVDLEEDRFLIHSLSDKTKQDLMSGEMQRKVARINLDTDIGQPEEVSFIPESQQT